MKDGLSGLLGIICFISIGIIEVVTIAKSFQESTSLGIFSLTPPGYFICPFIVGLGIPIAITFGVGLLALALADKN